MTKAIKLSALLLLVSTGIFAATPAKTARNHDEISVQSSAKEMVIDLTIQKETAGKSYVTFYDGKNNEIMRDYLAGKKSTEKAYNLSELDLGNYTMAITSNQQTVSRQLHVYEEYGKKTYVFLQ